MSVASCLGFGKAAHAEALFTGPHPLAGGACLFPLPPLPDSLAAHDSRNNRLLWALLGDLEAPLQVARSRYGADRIGVLLGTSTSGIAEGEAALSHHRDTGDWPAGFRYAQQELGSPAAFVAEALGVNGPAYVIATACSSSAKVFASARRLIRLGVVDAVVVGGADTLCRMTRAGFSALEAVSSTGCNPFSVNRDGISIGEGGALFLLTRDAAEIELLGVGESSDAHHVSAPDPSGRGAREAMEAALVDAGLRQEAIGYLNLHGTATPLNDAMESIAVSHVFKQGVPCSSTKALTGHTLGAAGAVEAAFLWLTLSRAWNAEGRLPPHRWDGEPDPRLPPLRFTDLGSRLPPGAACAVQSNSFAFGGSNCSLILGRNS